MYLENTRKTGLLKTGRRCAIFLKKFDPTNRVIDTKSQVIDMLFSRPYSYASLRLKFQIQTCERAYSLQAVAVWPAEEVGVSTYKLLGVNLSSNLKWNEHVNLITKKAAKRIYSVRFLKRAALHIQTWSLPTQCA
jgi:hypothetical protein